MDLNDPELEFSDLVYAYQSWVMAVINDEKLEGEEKLLTDDLTEDALNAMRFLPGEVTSAIETSLARVYNVDPDSAGIIKVNITGIDKLESDENLIDCVPLLPKYLIPR